MSLGPFRTAALFRVALFTLATDGARVFCSLEALLMIANLSVRSCSRWVHNQWFRWLTQAERLCATAQLHKGRRGDEDTAKYLEENVRQAARILDFPSMGAHLLLLMLLALGKPQSQARRDAICQ